MADEPIADPTTTESRPIALRPWQVRALLDGRLSQLRFPVIPSNSTVLGYAARRYWPNLQFRHAIPRRKASIMVAICGPEKAPEDVHLSVPYQHPEDRVEDDIADMPWYRVRPKWEAGDRLHVARRKEIAMEVGDVRVARIQESTDADAVACGSQTPIAMLPKPCRQGAWSERQAIQRLWDHDHRQHPERQWAANPWVWVLDVRRVEP